MPPVQIIHGQKDTIVTLRGSQNYIEALSAMGVKTQLVEMPFCNHGTGITSVNKSLMLGFLKDVEGMSAGN
jgi:Dipeptidyl aminopeptidases/acylaminoacyl-peptidases